VLTGRERFQLIVRRPPPGRATNCTPRATVTHLEIDQSGSISFAHISMTA